MEDLLKPRWTSGRRPVETRLLKTLQVFDPLTHDAEDYCNGRSAAAAGPIRADDERLATLRVGTEVYSNVTVTSVSVTDIFFTHSRGVGNASSKISILLSKKCFTSTPRSRRSTADQAKANALYNQEVRNSPPPKRPPAPEPEPEPQQPGTANGIRDHPSKPNHP